MSHTTYNRIISVSMVTAFIVVGGLIAWLAAGGGLAT